MPLTRCVWSGRRLRGVFGVSLWLVLSPFTARLGAQRVIPAAVAPERVRDTAQVTRPTADQWFGRDKVRHLGSSTAIQLMGYGGLRVGGASRHTGLVGASLVTFAAGIGKELWDARRGRVASWRDIAWDGVGLLVGTGLARIGDPP